jgi:hypothetical protein
MGAVPPPIGAAHAAGGWESERGRDGSRRAGAGRGAGAIALLPPALAGVRGREAGGSEAACWRRRVRARGVGQE